MFKKNKYLIMAISFLLTSHVSQANEASPLCQNTVKAICANSSYRFDMKKVLFKIKKEIGDDARKSAEPRLKEMKKNISALSLIKRSNEKAKIMNEVILKSTVKILGELESVSTNEQDIQKIKNYFYESIDMLSFREDVKEVLRERIKSVNVGNYGDVLSLLAKEGNSGNFQMDKQCGEDGLTNNAFAFILREGNVSKPYVLICPGFLINLKLINDKKERFNNVLQVLSHEIAHHIDPGMIGKYAYVNYVNCIAKNSTKGLAYDSRILGGCEKGKNSIECQKDMANSHSQEMVADEWALRIINLHAKSENLGIAETSKLLVDNYVKLCNTTDEGFHPSGDYRIGTMMINNPDIAELLNCQKPVSQNVSCTLDGEVNR